MALRRSTRSIGRTGNTRRAEQPAEPVSLALPAPQPQPAPQSQDKEKKKTYKHFLDPIHNSPAWVLKEILTNSGIYEEAMELLTVSRWPSFLTLFSDADKEDTCEVLSSIKLCFGDTYSFTYKHRNRKYMCSFSQLREIFGRPEDGEVQPAHITNRGRLWRDLTGEDGYVPSQTSARHLWSPANFYLHLALTRTIFTRKNNDKVLMTDLAVPHLISEGKVVD